MANPSLVAGISALFLTTCPFSSAATITYDFTGYPTAGSLGATTSGVPAGVTVSDITIGGGLDLSGGTDALRFESADTQGTTGTAITNGAYLSFTVTIGAGTFINLTSFTAVYNTTLTGAFYSNSRFYSSIDGTDDVTGDTIGVIGKQSGDATGAGTNVLSLTNPTTNSMRGANVTASDFTNLTNRSVTFYLPWVDNGSGTYHTDLDSLSLAFDVVPEPGSAILAMAGLIPWIANRRRSRR